MQKQVKCKVLILSIFMDIGLIYSAEAKEFFSCTSLLLLLSKAKNINLNSCNYRHKRPAKAVFEQN